MPIGKNKMNLSLDTELSLRFVTLRNLRKRAVFKIQEGIVRGFRETLQREGFTEIHSPKIVAQNAEGGANLFRMEYFGRRAYLAQSPQFYKQAMVPVLSLIHICPEQNDSVRGVFYYPKSLRTAGTDWR